MPDQTQQLLNDPAFWESLKGRPEVDERTRQLLSDPDVQKSLEGFTVKTTKEPTWTQSATSFAHRAIPPLVGGLVGSAAGPYGALAGSMAGMGYGAHRAQEYEIQEGLRKEYNPWDTALSTAMGAIPSFGVPLAGRVAPALVSTIPRRMAVSAAEQALVGGAASVPFHYTETGELPSLKDVGKAALEQGAIGGALHGAIEAGGAAKAKFTDWRARGGTPPAGPPPPGTPEPPTATGLQWKGREIARTTKIGGGKTYSVSFTDGGPNETISKEALEQLLKGAMRGPQGPQGDLPLEPPEAPPAAPPPGPPPPPKGAPPPAPTGGPRPFDYEVPEPPPAAPPPSRPAAPPAAAPTAPPPGRPPTTPSPQYREIPATEIKVDPKTYQFKGGGDAQGVTDRLRKVERWDDLTGAANPIIVHERLDGSLYVVDGHQRVGLAKRLIKDGRPVPPLNAVVLREADGITPGEALRRGAIINAQQGTGTATDLAKILRQRPLSGIERDQMPKDATSGGKLRTAEDLTNLGPRAFQAVINGEIHGNPGKNEQFGAIVGREIPDELDQLAAMKALREADLDSATEAHDFIKAIKADGFEHATQESLFGAQEVSQSLAQPIARILSAARRTLTSEKSALGNAVRNEARLQAKGNVLNREANVAGAQQAGALDDLLDKFAHTSGPVREELKARAAEVQRGDLTPAAGAARVLDILEREYRNLARPGGPPAAGPGRPVDVAGGGTGEQPAAAPAPEPEGEVGPSIPGLEEPQEPPGPSLPGLEEPPAGPPPSAATAPPEGTARDTSAPIDPNNLPPGWTPADHGYAPQPPDAEMDAASAKLADEVATYGALTTDEIHKRLDPLLKKQSWWKKRGIPTADDYVRANALSDELVRRRQERSGKRSGKTPPTAPPPPAAVNEPATRQTVPPNVKEWADALGIYLGEHNGVHYFLGQGPVYGGYTYRTEGGGGVTGGPAIETWNESPVGKALGPLPEDAVRAGQEARDQQLAKSKKRSAPPEGPPAPGGKTTGKKKGKPTYLDSLRAEDDEELYRKLRLFRDRDPDDPRQPQADDHEIVAAVTQVMRERGLNPDVQPTKPGEPAIGSRVSFKSGKKTVEGEVRDVLTAGKAGGKGAQAQRRRALVRVTPTRGHAYETFVDLDKLSPHTEGPPEFAGGAKKGDIDQAEDRGFDEEPTGFAAELDRIRQRQQEIHLELDRHDREIAKHRRLGDEPYPDDRYDAPGYKRLQDEFSRLDTRRKEIEAIQLYRERGGGQSHVRMAQAMKDRGIVLPARSRAQKAASNMRVQRLLQEAEAERHSQLAPDSPFAPRTDEPPEGPSAPTTDDRTLDEFHRQREGRPPTAAPRDWKEAVITALTGPDGDKYFEEITGKSAKEMKGRLSAYQVAMAIERSKSSKYAAAAQKVGERLLTEGPPPPTDSELRGAKQSVRNEQRRREEQAPLLEASGVLPPAPTVEDHVARRRAFDEAHAADEARGEERTRGHIEAYKQALRERGVPDDEIERVAVGHRWRPQTPHYIADSLWSKLREVDPSINYDEFHRQLEAPEGPPRRLDWRRGDDAEEPLPPEPTDEEARKEALHDRVIALDSELGHPFGDRDDFSAMLDTATEDLSEADLQAALDDLERVRRERLPPGVPAGTPVIETVDEYREMRRRYGIPNAIAVGEGPHRESGSLFIDDDTGEAVAFAWPDISNALREQQAALPPEQRTDPRTLGGGLRQEMPAPPEGPPAPEILSTGETQPGLPGLEDVRQEQRPTPTFDVPFSLTPPQPKPPKKTATPNQLRRLIEEEEGALNLSGWFPPRQDRVPLRDMDKLDAARAAKKPKDSWGDRMSEAALNITRDWYDRFTDIKTMVDEANARLAANHQPPIPHDADPGVIADLVAGGQSGPVQSHILRMRSIAKQAQRAGLLDFTRDVLDNFGWQRAWQILEEKRTAAFAAGDYQTVADLTNKMLKKEVTPLKRDPAELQSDLAQLQAHPRYNEALAYAQQVWDLNREVWDMAHHYGLISDAVYQQSLDRGPEYIPLERLLDVGDDPVQSRGSTLDLKRRDFLQRLEGSALMTDDPFELSMIHQARVIKEAGRNEAGRALVEMRNLDPTGMGKEIVALPPGQNPRRGYATVGVYENGVPQRYQVPEPLAAALHLAGPTNLGILTDALRFFKGGLQLGAVGLNTAWAPFNIQRDVTDMALMSKAVNPFNPVSLGSMARAWAEALGHTFFRDDVYHEVLRARVLHGTLLAQLDPVKDLAITHPWSYKLIPWRGPKDAFLDFMRRVSEEPTKVAAYTMLRKQGWREIPAAIEARRNAGTPDVASKGRHSDMLNMLWMFSHVNIKGVGRTIAQIKNNPGKFAAIAGAATLANLALWEWNSSFVDDDGVPSIDKVPAREKATNWIVVTPWTYVASNGARHHVAYRLAKAHVMQLISNPIEDAIAKYVPASSGVPNPKPDAWSDIAGNAVANMLPGNVQLEPGDVSQFLQAHPGPMARSVGSAVLAATNPMFGLPIDLAFNRDPYRRVPIVPGREPEIAPIEQFGPSTSPSSVALANAPLVNRMGISPRQIEYGVGRLWGGTGQMALSVADLPFRSAERQQVLEQTKLEGPEYASRLPVVGPIARRFVVSTGDDVLRKREQQLFNLQDEAQEVANTVRYDIQRGGSGAQRAQAYISGDPRRQTLWKLAGPIDNLSKTLTQIRNQIRLVQQTPDLTPEQRQQQLVKLRQQYVGYMNYADSFVSQIEAATHGTPNAALPPPGPAPVAPAAVR